MYGSLHDINSFPCEDSPMDKVKDASICLEAHNQVIWNLHLQHHATVDEFRRTYDSHYRILIDKAAKFFSKRPPGEKCLLILSAGFDASEHETKGMQRHGYCLPTEFFHRFTRDAIKLAEDHTNGKLLSVFEGGYSDRAITSGVFAHMTGMADGQYSSAEVNSWWTPSRLLQLEKTFKKPAKGRLPDDDHWAQKSADLAIQLLGSQYTPPPFPQSSTSHLQEAVTTTNSTDLSLLETPRMTLRERKPLVRPPPASAPPVRRRLGRPPSRGKLVDRPLVTQAQQQAQPPPVTVYQNTSVPLPPNAATEINYFASKFDSQPASVRREQQSESSSTTDATAAASTVVDEDGEVSGESTPTPTPRHSNHQPPINHFT